MNVNTNLKAGCFGQQVQQTVDINGNPIPDNN